MLLPQALDSGISELLFWDMTIAEVIRAIESKSRCNKAEMQLRASYDYNLARLITKGVSIVLGDKSAFPALEELYPTLFKEFEDKEKEKIQEQKNTLSTLRFLQFAQSYNDRFNK